MTDKGAGFGALVFWRNPDEPMDMTVSKTAVGFWAVACCGLASPALAQDVTYSAGVAVTSNYVSNGVTQTQDGPAVQPYLEVALGGFYAGTWMSNVDFGTGDSVEIDLYLGYRTKLADLVFLDLGYARYFYDDSGDCCGEFKLSALVPVGDDFGLQAYFAYDPENDKLNTRATLAYEVSEQFALSGTYG